MGKLSDIVEKIRSRVFPAAAREGEVVRVLFWTTTFQADNLALVRHLCTRRDFRVVVVTENRAALDSEPVHILLPLPCEIWDRGDLLLEAKVRWFAPHVTVVDNHFPKRRYSTKLFVLWHGFGWKGPNDMAEFSEVHKAIRRLTGISGTEPNPYFRWQCFGPGDLDHRNKVSGFARENVVSLGSAFTDDLLNVKIPVSEMRKFYPENFAGKKIALVACTWHYGRMFAHWGDDVQILQEILELLKSLNFVMILRLHDRRRFEPAYLDQLERFAAANPEVYLKFKDVDRDNMLDILVSDIMISNFSSILNYFYATFRPSIHVYPVASAEESFLWRTWKGGKVRTTAVENAKYVWKFPPEDNGGLLVRSLAELKAALVQADGDPACCAEKSAEFIRNSMAPVDGKTCSRIAAELLSLARTR